MMRPELHRRRFMSKLFGFAEQRRDSAIRLRHVLLPCCACSFFGSCAENTPRIIVPVFALIALALIVPLVASVAYTYMGSAAFENAFCMKAFVASFFCRPLSLAPITGDSDDGGLTFTNWNRALCPLIDLLPCTALRRAIKSVDVDPGVRMTDQPACVYISATLPTMSALGSCVRCCFAAMVYLT